MHFAVVVVAVVIIVIVVVSAFFFCIEERDMNVPGADTADAAALGESLGIVEKNLEKAEAKVKKFYELQFQVSTLQEEVGGIYKECSKELKHVEKSLSAVESFGNAATLRNGNSSRFAKFLRIEFDRRTMALESSWCETALLEKTRVVERAKGERAFHVFYELLQQYISM